MIIEQRNDSLGADPSWEPISEDGSIQIVKHTPLSVTAHITHATKTVRVHISAQQLKWLASFLKEPSPHLIVGG